MDSNLVLDYAMFQLTPTRTRCNLLVFSGKISEKIASGLVEPFTSHLNYAKDQIAKGGYSVTLRPPAVDGASWFTKAIFDRFVRFVRNPGILERVVQIEQEILQIESSIRSIEPLKKKVTELSGEGSLLIADGTEHKLSGSSKLEYKGPQGTPPEENSRISFQRLMDTRKAVLQKDQAMAYARAIVAGFESDSIHSLITFADAFGAERLRVACIEFKELYTRKHSDLQWMDELAAMQACHLTEISSLAGISFVDEHNESKGSSTGSSDESKVNEQSPLAQNPVLQQPLPWLNQFPMYNFNSPMNQQASSHQGHAFHPYYAHLGWPLSAETAQRSKHGRNRNRKDKASDSDEQTASSGSSSETDFDEVTDKTRRLSSKSRGFEKKNKNKSLKTVVIRTINYITSQKNHGEESRVDEESVREGVDNVLSYKTKGRSDDYIESGSRNDFDSNDNRWDAFQTVLMSCDEPASNGIKMHGPDESQDQHYIVSNAFTSQLHDALGFESEKTKIKILNADASVLAIQRNGENFGADMVDFIDRGGFAYNLDDSIEKADLACRETEARISMADDSFIMQSRAVVDENYSSPWRTDESIMVESSTFSEVFTSDEPDDLCMVLLKESQESTMGSREIDCQLEDNAHLGKELPANGKSIRKKMTEREARSKGLEGFTAKNRDDPLSKSKRISSTNRLMVHRSKLEKEEEERRRKEELLIERRKRIAERTAGSLKIIQRLSRIP